MTRKELGILIFRVMAIYTFLQTPQYTGILFNSFFSLTQSPVMFSLRNVFHPFLMSLTMLMYLILAVTLWAKAEWLSFYLMQQSDKPIEMNQITTLDLQSIVFAGIGLMLILFSFPDLVQYFYTNQMTVRISGTQNQIANANTTRIITAGLKFVLGFVLLLQSYNLAEWLVKRIRPMAE